MITRERPCLVDGRAEDCGRLPDGLYVWQNVRTEGVHGLNAGRHLELLNAAAREVLGFGVQSDARGLESQISKLLSDNGYPSDGSFSYVTLRQYLTGEFMIVANEILPYRTRKLRSVFPRAGIVDYDLPFSERPSSLSEAAHDVARAALRRENPDLKCVLRCNGAGEIVSADGAPLFIIEKECVIAPPREFGSVEFECVEMAAAKSGLQFATEPLDRERILAAEELFYADHRGVTSVLSCEGHLYIHLLTERIGKQY